MTHLHPLHTDIRQPERFTYPFSYEPHPLCLLATEELKEELKRMTLTEGKMFGVLVVRSHQGLGFLAAYSGLLEGRNDWAYFVPPVFDAQQPDGYFKTREREIMQAEDHKQMSQELQLWLFRQYRMLNGHGETRDLVEIWQNYHRSPRIREKFPLPPGGTGDCCAPKLLQYAYLHRLHGRILVGRQSKGHHPSPRTILSCLPGQMSACTHMDAERVGGRSCSKGSSPFTTDSGDCL